MLRGTCDLLEMWTILRSPVSFSCKVAHTTIKVTRACGIYRVVFHSWLNSHVVCTLSGPTSEHLDEEEATRRRTRQAAAVLMAADDAAMTPGRPCEGCTKVGPSVEGGEVHAFVVSQQSTWGRTW